MKMKSTNWRKLKPTLIFMAGTFIALLIRGREDPELSFNLFLFLFIPMILIGVIVFWAIERGSRARSGRIWQVMEQRHPDEIKYLFHVFPKTRSDLDRLGLHATPAVVATPVIGVVFGPDVTFWEEGNVGWSLRIAYSNIEAVELASTENSARYWAAIRLLLIDRSTAAERGGAADPVPQRGGLVLSLHHRSHKKLNEAERVDLVGELNSRLKFAGTTR